MHVYKLYIKYLNAMCWATAWEISSEGLNKMISPSAFPRGRFGLIIYEHFAE